jgi:hypothetical protein
VRLHGEATESTANTHTVPCKHDAMVPHPPVSSILCCACMRFSFKTFACVCVWSSGVCFLLKILVLFPLSTVPYCLSTCHVSARAVAINVMISVYP